MAKIAESKTVGGGSSATVYSDEFSVNAPYGTKLCVELGATVTTEKFAVYLQFNLDGLTSTYLGWMDYRVSTVDFRTMSTGTVLAHTDGTFTTTVGGIISATGSFFTEFTPFQGRWRLAFQPQSSSTSVVVTYALSSI